MLLTATPAAAQPIPPAAHADEAPDLMNTLADRGLHDLLDEAWDLYSQATYITVYKPRFSAAYTNLGGSNHSLTTDPERSFTGTLTLFFGLRLWRGGELYFAPEMVSEQTLSQLHGLSGAIENFELQKTGSSVPSVYRSRLFYRHHWSLGGASEPLPSNPLQLGRRQSSRQIILSLGYLSFLDVFDRNNVTGDLRQSFFNEGFMAHGAWDFPADARGYTWGALLELTWDTWALRVGRMAVPKIPNLQPVDLRLWAVYGDAIEMQHSHRWGQHSGAVRLLAFRNRQSMGDFDGAMAQLDANPTHNATRCPGYSYDSKNILAPDVCWSRQPNVKWGLGFNAEQELSDSMGVFLRALWSDGRREVGSYNSADQSLATGWVARGSSWGRDFDRIGVGLSLSRISASHARYLARGGLDSFLGDGALRVGTQTVLEAFYSANFWRALWLSADVQLVWNPGFNADRGPVALLGGRLHVEY